jgi:hypothetical protein
VKRGVRIFERTQVLSRNKKELTKRNDVLSIKAHTPQIFFLVAACVPIPRRRVESNNSALALVQISVCEINKPTELHSRPHDERLAKLRHAQDTDLARSQHKKSVDELGRIPILLPRRECVHLQEIVSMKPHLCKRVRDQAFAIIQHKIWEHVSLLLLLLRWCFCFRFCFRCCETTSPC